MKVKIKDMWEKLVIKNKDKIEKLSMGAIKTILNLRNMNDVELYIIMQTNGKLQVTFSKPELDENEIICVHLSNNQIQSIVKKLKSYVSPNYTTESEQELLREYVLEMIDTSIEDCLYEYNPTPYDEIYYLITQL